MGVEAVEDITSSDSLALDHKLSGIKSPQTEHEDGEKKLKALLSKRLCSLAIRLQFLSKERFLLLKNFWTVFTQSFDNFHHCDMKCLRLSICESLRHFR